MKSKEIFISILMALATFSTALAEGVDEGRGSVCDVDGNWYTTKVFGSLEWMTENLRVLHWNDGTAIPYGAAYTNAPGSKEDFAVYYKFPNDDAQNVADYGILYTFNVAFDHEGNPPETVIPRNLCPAGWRVPTRTEWATLGTATYDGDYVTITGIPAEFNPQFAGDFNTGGFNGFGTQTQYWVPEWMMPGYGYGCKWLLINASDPTTIQQSNNRNNNTKSIRCVREAQDANAINSPASTSITIFPNPAGEFIKIKGVKGEETLTISDLSGKILLTEKVSEGANLATGKLANGVYLAKVGDVVLKFIKQ
ncbi:MAG: T9SS type A sorting domain-containing protein [Candidatus Symbiothrix sp.]|jgi:uncharacterized protein (TIGR02145 family)|nr:T9SS type A sorting domain-containing protein [Candidatus Symbiothrix sp.]